MLVNRFKKYIKVGLNNEANRKEWLNRVLHSIPVGSSILDAGAGELKYKEFCTHLNYIAQDFAQYDGKGNGTGLQTGSWDQSKLDIISDITSIPLADNSLDAIMCIEVLEHLPNPIEALSEFSRLLKSGGKLIITAPFCSLTHFAPYHFYSGFNTYFFNKFLSDYNFEILEIEKNGNFYEYLAQELLRLPVTNKQYQKRGLRIWEYGAIFVLLHALKRLSKQDLGSNNILFFGTHIFAQKK